MLSDIGDWVQWFLETQWFRSPSKRPKENRLERHPKKCQGRDTTSLKIVVRSGEKVMYSLTEEL